MWLRRQCVLTVHHALRLGLRDVLPKNGLRSGWWLRFWLHLVPGGLGAFEVFADVAFDGVALEADGAGVAGFAEEAEKAGDVEGASIQGLDELAPGHGLGVSGIGAVDADEHHVGH